MKIQFPFSEDEKIIYKYLLEDGFDNKYSLKQKLYYNFIRPYVSISFRQRLQERLLLNVQLKDNFINDELVKILANFEPIKIKYKEDKSSAIILTHDVEEQEGFNFIPKVLELEERYSLKSSWNIVPYKYKIDEGIINLIKSAGHEVGIHGYNHDGKLYYSEKIFNERVPLINKAIKNYGAVGFRSPQVHRNLNWLQKLDIEYDASCFDYDPFQPFPGGTSSIWPFIAGKFVELPYTLPQDHTIFHVLKQKDISIWQKKAEWVAKNNGVILTLTHPDYLIPSRNFEMYGKLLEYLKSFNNSWYCLPKELANYWKDKHLEKK
jgi:peptidoglycan/xylan/chitin deacetylase (PgdA/CDA1 family)